MKITQVHTVFTYINVYRNNYLRAGDAVLLWCCDTLLLCCWSVAAVLLVCCNCVSTKKKTAQNHPQIMVLGASVGSPVRFCPHQTAKPSKTNFGALRGHSGGPSGTPLRGHLEAQVGLMLDILGIIFEVVFHDMLEEPLW